MCWRPAAVYHLTKATERLQNCPSFIGAPYFYYNSPNERVLASWLEQSRFWVYHARSSHACLCLPLPQTRLSLPKTPSFPPSSRASLTQPIRDNGYITPPVLSQSRSITRQSFPRFRQTYIQTYIQHTNHIRYTAPLHKRLSDLAHLHLT